MAWTPKLATIKTQKVADNLLAYVIDDTRQRDAYTWAGDATLKLIKTISASVANRLNPIYPAIAFSDDDDAQDLSQEITDGTYRCLFEISIQSAEPDEAVRQARLYRDALVSMIVNCPISTLIANTGADSGSIVTIETGFEQIKTNEKQNDFLQQFQIRIGAILRAGFNA